MCLGEAGRLYAFTAKRGLVRIGEDGEPEVSWSEPVNDLIADWVPANVVMGWDNDHQCVVAAHGNHLLAFNVQTEQWSADLDASTLITGNFCSAITQDGELILSSNNGVVDIQLHGFNRGTGLRWEAYLPSTVSKGISDDLFQVLGMCRFDNTVDPVTVSVFRDGNIVTPVESRTFTPSVVGPQHLPQARLQFNARDLRSHQIMIAQQGAAGDAGPDWITALGESFGIL